MFDVLKDKLDKLLTKGILLLEKAKKHTSPVNVIPTSEELKYVAARMDKFEEDIILQKFKKIDRTQDQLFVLFKGLQNQQNRIEELIVSGNTHIEEVAHIISETPMMFVDKDDLSGSSELDGDDDDNGSPSSGNFGPN